MELSKNSGFASIFLLLILSSPSTIATDFVEVSIYNIYYGTLIYSYHDFSNKYIYSDIAYQLSTGEYPARATWKKIYNSNGSVSFRNKFSSAYCLSYYYGTNYQLTQEYCVEDDTKQQFKIELVPSGAYLFKFMNALDECIQQPIRKDNVVSKKCDKDDDKFHWALIPYPMNR